MTPCRGASSQGGCPLNPRTRWSRTPLPRIPGAYWTEFLASICDYNVFRIDEGTGEILVSQKSEKQSDASVCYNRNIQGFDNPGYESQSYSDNSRVRESVISPPRRRSVIQGSQGAQRASVISPPANKVGVSSICIKCQVSIHRGVNILERSQHDYVYVFA